MTKYVIWARRPIEVNTDPQRRCYYGVFPSSRMDWSAWADLYPLPTKEEAEESVASWKALNPTHDYKALPEGVSP